MTKVYTSTVKNPQKTIDSPKKTVIDSILNFSKSLEVLKASGVKKQPVIENVELILN